ncbi:MAG TPA: metallophosphoesterase [Tepidisphaeraceae bacterium]|jgi:Icc protein|nr:metallophosphoesterase [Tepidisphaeraceae bacterium]
MSDYIKEDRSADGIDRRGFLKCMAWAGAGVLWTMKDGVLQSRALGAQAPMMGDFSFVQLSDSHVGFNKGVYGNVVGTFQLAVARINALPTPPALVLHTGDLTHLSKPQEFDTVAQVMKSIRTGQSFFVPGEHDYFVDNGMQYKDRFGKGTLGAGWHSFDFKGVHFIGLVNVANLSNGKTALGALGTEQLEWLQKDVAPLGSSTPIVVFAHVPLWTIYPEWGWGTDDSAQALGYLKRFGSVTVLNGHIHQILQKVEGNITFHTARSTAFPQPEPGKAESPGPMKNVPAEKVKSMLGLTSVKYVETGSMLAVVDSTLA